MSEGGREGDSGMECGREGRALSLGTFGITNETL